MNSYLTPNVVTSFADEKYWDTFFKRQGKRPFEWYGEYRELMGVIHKYAKPRDKVFVIGCGNSSLSAELYDVGFQSIANIDVSRVVIKHMKQKYGRNRPGLTFEQMDATATTYPDGRFTVVLDKGTLDSLFVDEEEETKLKIRKLFEEIDRVMKQGGRYMCVSLLQDFILKFILDYFSEKGWLIRVCRCVDVATDGNKKSPFNVFMVVCTKLKKMSDNQSVIELCLDDETIERVDKEQVIEMVSKIQTAEMMCDRLRNRNISKDIGEIGFDITWKPGDRTPRYTVVIVDGDKHMTTNSMSYAAFIVPHGRESEWSFSSPEGRQILRESCHVDRLTVILLHRDHRYGSMKEIKEELSDTVIKFAPATMITRNERITFLSLGTDVGLRDIKLRWKSEYSGEFVVEDVQVNKEIFRRLIFLNNPQIIQSEIRLKPVQNEEGLPVLVIDDRYQISDYHLFLHVGIALETRLNPKELHEVLVLGLGGGVLVTNILKHFETVRLTALEIDEDIYKMAVQFFGLRENERFRVIVGDGLAYIRQAAERGLKYDAIIFDVDNKDPRVGLSSPPTAFLESQILGSVKECLNPEGIFLINFVCRARELRQRLLKEIDEHFVNMVALKAVEYVNEVIVSCKEPMQFSSEDLQAASASFRNLADSHNSIIENEDFDITRTMTTLSLNKD